MLFLVFVEVDIISLGIFLNVDRVGSGGHEGKFAVVGKGALAVSGGGGKRTIAIAATGHAIKL